MRLTTSAGIMGIILAAAASLTVAGRIDAHATGALAFGTAVALPTSDGGTEPRYAVTPDGKHYVVSNHSGTATVWESDDGLTNWHVTGTLANQNMPTIDVDLVSMPAGSTHPGRLVAVELDFQGVNFRISYSDDGGVMWTPSGVAAGVPNTIQGGMLGDQDRPWLTTGPGDRAYLLFHNLVSGAVAHNMYVSTSTDGGANFGVPIPVTSPGTQAYTDLQCADSGGPSNLLVNPRDGRVYAVWGTRSAPAGGGCLASVTGAFEVNVVAATRVWVATAPASGTADPTQWTQSLAVDDSAGGQIVGMQLGPAALDSANNLFVIYPESVNVYPNYDGAAIKFVHANQTDILANPFGALGPAHQIWSAPVTVAPSGGAGHLLPHIVAGGPGQIDFAYFEGDEIAGATPATRASWFLVAGQSLDALDANPVITQLRVNYPGGPPGPQPAFSGFTASLMMGACGTGPTAGVQNGLLCSRSTDVWGVALDNNGRFQITWPTANATTFGTCTAGNCTYVTAQTDGPTIAPQPSGNVPEAPWAPALIVIGMLFAAAAALGVRRRQRM